MARKLESYTYENGTGHGPIPTGPDGNPRTDAQINIRMTEGEKSFIRYAAAREGLWIADFARGLLCPDEELAALVRHASRAGMSLRAYVDLFVHDRKQAGLIGPRRGKK